MHLQELKTQTPTQLIDLAENLEIENANSMRRQDLMFAILRQLAENDQAIFGSGVLETLQDGFGFLRSPESNYLPGPDDIYVSPSQIRRFGLRTGDTLEGQIRAPRDGERYFALLKLNNINFDPPENLRHKVNFDNLTPLYPEQRFSMEVAEPKQKDTTSRILDIVAPLGKGQRALIVAPPRTGKTMMLQNIAHSIEENHPEAYLIVLLVDERPEEVTDMDRSVRGEVVSSTFDEPATTSRPGGGDGDREGQAAGGAQARRGDSSGFDHEPATWTPRPGGGDGRHREGQAAGGAQARRGDRLLDSITRLARAYKAGGATVVPSSGNDCCRGLTGGVDAKVSAAAAQALLRRRPQWRSSSAARSPLSRRR